MRRVFYHSPGGQLSVFLDHRRVNLYLRVWLRWCARTTEGFIHSFNLAMLAKQGRRLWQNEDSLCARILKAKYYADTTVLDAKPKSAMSYFWRSVLRGIDLLKKRIIWRAGDGVGLKIWADP